MLKLLKVKVELIPREAGVEIVPYVAYDGRPWEKSTEGCSTRTYHSSFVPYSPHFWERRFKIDGLKIRSKTTDERVKEEVAYWSDYLNCFMQENNAIVEKERTALSASRENVRRLEKQLGI